MGVSRRGLALLALVLWAAAASSFSEAGIITGVDVINEPPRVGPVITDQDIVPSTNSSTPLWCNSSVSDLNGITDVNYTAAFIWHQATATENSPNNVTNHYTPVSTREVATSNTSKDLFFLFSLHPHVNQGVWVCRVNARDRAGLRSSNETTFNIHPIVCSNGRWDEGEIFSDCGGICPSCLAPASFEMTVLERSSNTSTFAITSVTPDHMAITEIAASDLYDGGLALNASNIVVSPANMTLEGRESKAFQVTVSVPFRLNSSTTLTGFLTFYAGVLFNVSFPLTVHAVVPNYPPEVTEIRITSPVVLIVNTSVSVWCNATVRDENGFSDIRSAKVTLWHNDTFDYSGDDPKNHYTSSNTFFSQSNDSEYGTVGALFNISSDAMAGLWYCKVSVSDSANMTSFLIKPFTVYSASCSDGSFFADTEELTDCGKTCPPCLTVDDLVLSVVAGSNASRDVMLSSYSIGPLLIKKFAIPNFTTYDRETTLNSTNKIDPESFVLEPRSSKNLNFSISTGTGIVKDEYYAKIGVSTNTTVNATISAKVVILLRGGGYMSVDVNKTCAGEPVTVKVTNDENGQPLENVNMTVLHNRTLVYFGTTLKDGSASFKPKNTGLYTLEAAKDGFNTETVNITLSDCASEGTCFDRIQNCHNGDCEIGIDCGGPCPPCSSCSNGVRDNGEEGIDCGGSCMPCHCFNGVRDEDEKGIDCGGSCEICPNMTFISMLNIRATPPEVTVGEEFNVAVTNNRDEGLSAFVKIQKPDSSELFLSTDKSGLLTVKSDVIGYWSLTALKAGYLPASTRVNVKEKLTPQAIITKTVSYVVPAAAIGFSIFYLRRRRKKIVADRAALRKIIESDKLGDYKKVHVIDVFYAEFSEKAGKQKDRMVPVKLSDEQLVKAEEVSSKYGISMELAESLVLADSLKAKTLVVGSSVGSLGDRYRGVRFVFV